MDLEVSEKEAVRPLRRSTRQSAVLRLEATPRGPLKRTRGTEKQKQAPVSAINGSKDEEDEETSNKKSRLEAGDAAGDSGDETEMDIQESAEAPETNEDKEVENGQDSGLDSPGSHRPKRFPDIHGDVNLSPRVILFDSCRSSCGAHEAKRVNTTTKGPVAPTKSATQIKSPDRKEFLVPPKVTSMAEYRRTMEANVKQAGKPTVTHRLINKSQAFDKSKQQMTNSLPRRETVTHNKQGVKKAPVKTSGRSSRGFLWYLWRFVLLVLLASCAVALVHTIIPVLKRTVDGAEHPSRAVNLEKFVDHLTLLEAQFPSQRPELWKRSKKHLERHLNSTSQPTEPVSLIFTAGRKAENTLRCLAQGLASCFSSALNASVLYIDGASKASEGSDQVKLDIDNQLRAAFEGDQPAAVIHRFEELPPGSTLIFYRYCDHENAAYKKVFLLFTVLLPQDELGHEQSLKDVEEIVQEYVKERLVGEETAFDKMDIDKYGGLWSRISHLILPVVSEREVEQNGCLRTKPASERK